LMNYDVCSAIVPECRLRLPQDFAADERASGPHWVDAVEKVARDYVRIMIPSR
jgi:hypothetical protein